jgi:CheY-like chemotaxis protein
MSNPYRILMVEDVETESELVGHYLRRAGMDCQIRRVEKRQPLMDSIRDFSPDVILCDFSLPGFSGTEAFDVAHEIAPAIPFIFWSGSIPLTHVEKAKAAGAAGVVLKGNYGELIAALVRVIPAH